MYIFCQQYERSVEDRLHLVHLEIGHSRGTKNIPNFDVEVLRKSKGKVCLIS